MLTATSVMLAVKGANAAPPPGIRTWAASGRPLIEIPGASEAPDANDDGPDVFAPVVFLWPLDSPVDLAGLCEVVAAETGHRLDLVPRTSRDRRSGAAIPLSDVGTALDVVDALARQSRAARTPIRLIADFGPVIDARSRISDTLISRLSGASDLIGFPPLTPLATISFAAQARLEAGDRIGLVPIGRTAPGPAADSRPLAAREVYALYFAGQSDARYSLDIVSLIQG